MSFSYWLKLRTLWKRVLGVVLGGGLFCFVGFLGGFLLFFEQYFYTFEFGKIVKASSQ